MVDAAQTALFVTTKEHAGPAVRAQGINYADLALGIAEGDQVFAEHPQAHWCPIRFW